MKRKKKKDKKKGHFNLWYRKNLDEKLQVDVVNQLIKIVSHMQGCAEKLSVQPTS